MRAKDDPAFIEFLMRIGNGREPTNEKGEIRIPRPMIIPYSSIDESLESLIQSVYPDMFLFETTPFEVMKRTILCPKNEFVNDINSNLIEKFSGQEIVYTSDDRAKSGKDHGDYADYLNNLQPKGLTCHKLVLKKNSPIILLRNINPTESLCNDTRLLCKNLLPNVIGVVIASGQHSRKHVWIPKIPLEANPNNSKYLIPFVRRQILVRLYFSMTINKSQGQALNYVGLYLKQPVLCHEQLYVALSSVKLLIISPICRDPRTEYTTNIV
ncbi:DNA helicase [Lithospermum erythrorhizon]|uniref:DNA helicase n=1 Tax=Lithospermum erythrorhizon TaxID=34254 RepID=A0AAV3S2D4_LITER